ncbi:MAG: ABC transporter ATP-binding protein, partial [Thermomicrobiales bacterium]
GKSVTLLAVLRFVDKSGRIVSGSVRFDGIDLVNLGKKDLHAIRGNRISMVFQRPNASLHPCFNAARQISEVYEIHRNSSRKAGVEKAVDMLRAVGIPDPKRRAKSFPHQLSGGQAQRVMIAMALAAEPELLIADEPTTALDVTIQAQILDLMRNLQNETGAGVILITHSMGVVAGMADRVQVMYAGHIIETADTGEIFANPRHPYTVGLMQSIPRLDASRREKLRPIRGMPPDLIDLPDMCPFTPRCNYASEKCEQKNPPLMEVTPGHYSACWFWEEVSKDDDPDEVARAHGHTPPSSVQAEIDAEKLAEKERM